MTTVTEPDLDQAAAQRDETPLATPTDSAGRHYVGRRYLQLVLVLGAVSALGPLTIDTYLPALPTITTQLGAGDAQAQLTITGLLAGLGLGQLVIGPLSDSVGRRRPLLMGLVAHAAMSVLCALAPSIGLLVVARTLQGVAGAAVAVVGMAVVRDLFTGVRAAQLLSRLMLVIGVAPVLAPSLGSALLKITSWRGIFVAIAAGALLMLVLAFFGLRETLPPESRRSATVRAHAQAYAALFRDRVFIGMVLVAGLMFATLFTYIAGSPFILQGRYGLSPAWFGIAFSLNAVGLITMTQVNPLLVRWVGPVRVLRGGVVAAFAGTIVLLVTATTGWGGIVGFLVPVWVIVAAAGLSFPNSPAIALSRHGEAAGTAAAVLGSAQFVIGGLAAPLVGLLADGTAVPMAAIMVATTGSALVLMLSLRRRLHHLSFD